MTRVRWHGLFKTYTVSMMAYIVSMMAYTVSMMAYTVSIMAYTVSIIYIYYGSISSSIVYMCI